MNQSSSISSVVEKTGRLIIRTVPTPTGKVAKAGEIKVRVDRDLKAASAAKAKRERTTVTAVIINGLSDYVAGTVRFCARGGHSKKQHDASMAHFRSVQAANHNLLLDLRQLALTQKDSPLAGPGVAAMLDELHETGRQLFRALGGATS